MRYLVDTNVLSDLDRGRTHPNLRLWFHNISPSELAIPVNAIFEFQKGIEMARPTHPQRAAQRERWLERLINEKVRNVIAMDASAARIYAMMVCTPALRNFFLTPGLRTKKIKTGDDLAIAAIAIRSLASVVTFNERDFLLIHDHFPLPGLFHPGRLEWRVKPPNKILRSDMPMQRNGFHV